MCHDRLLYNKYIQAHVTAIFLSLLQEFYSDFYAVSPHVFSLNIPNCLRVSSDLLSLCVLLTPG